MRTTKGASLADLRHWRRDDLDGLDAAYPTHPVHEFTHWRDLVFPAAPAIDGAHSVAGTEVIRSGALADVPPNHARHRWPLLLRAGHHARDHALARATVIDTSH